MAAHIVLSEIVDALEIAADEMHSFMHRQTGEVLTLSDETLGMAEDGVDKDLPEWQEEELREAQEVVGSEDWLPLPSKFDLHEWEIMNQFGRSLAVPEQREEILEGIHGSGAFRVFKSTIRRLRLEEAWYAFKRKALEDTAKAWLKSHGFEVPGGDSQAQPRRTDPAGQEAQASTPSEADRQRFLGLAIAEAKAGAIAGQGGPFGAVVVKDGVVIAKASNAVVANNDPTAHAEVQAIRAACAALGSFKLDGCDIYASCEPCPMCLGAILWARPRALYFAATREQAAQAGFDDAVFYQVLAGDNTVPLVREKREHPDADAPFTVYAKLPGTIRY